jgi:hypothetical protein
MAEACVGELRLLELSLEHAKPPILAGGVPPPD